MLPCLHRIRYRHQHGQNLAKSRHSITDTFSCLYPYSLQRSTKAYSSFLKRSYLLQRLKQTRLVAYIYRLIDRVLTFLFSQSPCLRNSKYSTASAMDVPRQRFQESLPFILEDIVNAHFVSLDLEFSGIAGGQLNRPRTNGKASGGKQTLQERYADIKNAVERYQCLQLGLTCVMEDRKSRQ